MARREAPAVVRSGSRSHRSASFGAPSPSSPGRIRAAARSPHVRSITATSSAGSPRRDDLRHPGESRGPRASFSECVALDSGLRRNDGGERRECPQPRAIASKKGQANRPRLWPARACLRRRSVVSLPPGKRPSISPGDISVATPRAGHTARRRLVRLRVVRRRQRLAPALCLVRRHAAARQPRHGVPRLYLQGADRLTPSASRTWPRSPR